MAYSLELDNGDKVDFENTDEIMQWLGDHSCKCEPNAKLYGIDETIADQGSVCIYRYTNRSDQADGRIRKA